MGQTEAERRAVACWLRMTQNERAGVRFGMSPLWVLQADLGGKAVGWPDIQKDGEAGRLLTLALCDCTKAVGGMIV